MKAKDLIRILKDSIGEYPETGDWEIEIRINDTLGPLESIWFRPIDEGRIILRAKLPEEKQFSNIVS